MLGGGEEHPLLHQAGSITNSSDVVPLGLYGEVVEVDASEYDACFGRRGNQMNVSIDTSVNAHTLG
jgi:hypothetical protein